MKTIIISSNICWSLFNFRKNLIAELLRRGFKVVIVSKEDSYTSRLVELGCHFEPLLIEPSGTNPLKDIRTTLDFIKVFRRVNPDYVLNFSPKNNIYASIAAIFFEFKVINNIAGLGVAFISNDFLSKLVKLLYKFSQKRADLIFFQNQDDKKIFIENNICNNNKTDILPGSGVDLKRFYPRYKKPSDKTVFILVARMLFDKGIGYYVDAARVLVNDPSVDVEFRLLGFIDGDNPSAVSKEQMDSWVNEGIIRYLGVSDNVENELEDADCVVLPSFYREGVPRSLLEAGALGKPIITTESVGCRETVIDGVTGFLCEPKDIVTLTEAMYKFTRLSHIEKEEMSRRSQSYISSKFDENIVIKKYMEQIT